MDTRARAAQAGEAIPGGPALGANALRVLERRYLLRDGEGRLIETPAGLVRRTARAVAPAETAHGGDAAAWEARFSRLLGSLEFLPNSPTLMNAGGPLGNLAACFTLPVGDSLPAIFEAVKQTAIIQQTGGGVGFTFGRVRPRGDAVSTTHGVASGPVSFMDVFDKAAETIQQGGRRRGALMGILPIDHPDIVEFVTAKADPRRLTQFNVSVALTDAFMRAAAAAGEVALRNPRTGAVARALPAARLFRLICNLAWANAEPGVLFWDRIARDHPTPHLGPVEATNPCGEQDLLPYESCTLGSLNLARFSDGADVAWQRLGAAARDAVRFLDDVIDASSYPLAEIASATRATRKIGLGVMGWADLLVRLGLPYDSDEALALADRAIAFVAAEARAASAALAAERGPFPEWSRSLIAGRGGPPLRNAKLTTVAPTGSISLIAGCSAGIEPLYAVAWRRRALDGETLAEVHPLFVQAARDAGVSDAAVAAVADRGTTAGVAGIPDRLRRLFATAFEIPPDRHVRVQAAFQKHIDASVSKTVNLPRDASPDDVARAYRLAWDLGCKGVTVYRDGSRAGQVLSAGANGGAGADGGEDDAAAPAALAAREAHPAGACPECNAAALRQAGCTFCRDCGWSACTAG